MHAAALIGKIVLSWISGEYVGLLISDTRRRRSKPVPVTRRVSHDGSAGAMPELRASLRASDADLGSKRKCERCGRRLIISDSGIAGEWAASNSDADRSGAVPVGTDPSGRWNPRRSSAADELPAQFGRHQILKKLGHGGMGSVYLAHDSQLDRQVVLKVPHIAPENGPELQERFQREARTAASFRHVNFCPIYDVGQVDGLPYLTMAYLEGQTLADLIETGGPMRPRRRPR